jgi:ketosteroid isomerase-like protein
MENENSALDKFGPAEQEVFDTSESWSRAIVANDPEQIGKYMTDDWLLVSEHGVLKKELFLSLVAAGELAHDSMEMVEVTRLTIYGDTAILAGRVTTDTRFGGQSFKANEWTSDVFLREDAGWKCVITHVTSVLERPD